MGVVSLASFVVAAVAVVAAQPPAPPPYAAPPPVYAKADPVRSCESLAAVTLPNTTIVSAAADTGDATTPPSCRITAIVTHPPAGDAVKVFIGLPLKNWNGRFQGVGGGGFSGGSAQGVRQPLTAGYAAGATDTGHEGGRGSFALDAAGRLNWQLIRDNAHLGIHDMTVTGKALTREFYGNAPRYAYFNGCSTGGRQGLMEAQRYPADYDGILSAAPAINWPKLHVEQLWGPLVMLEARNFVPACKFAAATAAAVAACDTIDGVKDGVIEDPVRCTYDPKALAGTAAGECGAFTDADAAIVRAIWEGPRRRDGTFLWYGLARGADISGAERNRRHAADGAAVDHHARLVAVLPHAESGVGLGHAHPRARTSSSGISRSKSSAPSSAPTTRTCRRFATAAARSSCGTASPIN